MDTIIVTTGAGMTPLTSWAFLITLAVAVLTAIWLAAGAPVIGERPKDRGWAGRHGSQSVPGGVTGAAPQQAGAAHSRPSDQESAGSEGVGDKFYSECSATEKDRFALELANAIQDSLTGKSPWRKL